MKKKMAMILAASMIATLMVTGCSGSTDETTSNSGSGSSISADGTYTIKIGNGQVETLPMPQGCL